MSASSSAIVPAANVQRQKREVLVSAINSRLKRNAALTSSPPAANSSAASHPSTRTPVCPDVSSAPTPATSTSPSPPSSNDAPHSKLSSRRMTFKPTAAQRAEVELEVERGSSDSSEEEDRELEEQPTQLAHSPLASTARLPTSSSSASHLKRPALPARPRPARRSAGRPATASQPADQPAAATAAPPAIVMLGSAAFESVMEQVERTQQQRTTLQRQSAFPFIHVHSRHTPQPQPQQHQQEAGQQAAADEQPAASRLDAPLELPSQVTRPPTPQHAVALNAHAGSVDAKTTDRSSASPPHTPPPSTQSAAAGQPVLREAAPSAAATQSAATAASSTTSAKALTHLLLLCCEVLSSERTYVGRLDELIAGYVLPLKSRHSSLGVARDDVDQLFSYVEVIGELHHKILEHLQRKAAAMSSSAAGQQAVDSALLDTCVANIAACFVQFAAYLKMYVQYVNQYNASMETLKRLADNKKFTKFLATLPQQQAASSTAPLFELQSLLILPIQRIPRYELFLVSISKHVDASFPCHSQLASALTLVQRLASLINESKRQAENGVKMMELKRRVKGLTPQQPLLAPHRRLLREDAVLQLLPKRREYVLVTFNDGVLLLSHSYRLKGLYLADDIAAVRHYEPKAAHAAAVARNEQLEPMQEREPQQARDDDEVESEADEDDSEYPSCVEIELKKGRPDADSGSNSSSSGQAGARLKRFSLAFTAAVASMTDLNTIVLQFASEADKLAWATEWARQAHQPTQQHTPLAANATTLSAMLSAMTINSSATNSSSADSGQPSPPSLSSPAACPTSPLPATALPTLPPSLPTLTSPPRHPPCPVLSPSFGASPAHLSAGAVPVLPARPRPTAAKLQSAASSPSTLAGCSNRPADWHAQPFSYTAAAPSKTSHSHTRQPAATGSSTGQSASHSSGSAPLSSPPPLLSAFQRSQQHAAHSASKQAKDKQTVIQPPRLAAHNKENRHRTLFA